MWELRKWGWGPKLPFNSIQPKRKKDNLFILLTKRNMQKLTCYTRWPSQWQLSATCLPLLCSASMSIGSASKVLIARFHERAVSPKQKLKINQLENILNLIGQGLCNSIWLREGPATFRRPSLNIFGARQGWPELKRVCKWAPLPLRGNQSTKKNNTPSDFRPPTRDGGDCYKNSPVGLFRLKLLILENILQLWRTESVSIESKFWLCLTSYDVGKMLSFCCLFQQSIVSSNCQLSLPVVMNDDENAALGVYKFST